MGEVEERDGPARPRRRSAGRPGGAAGRRGSSAPAQQGWVPPPTRRSGRGCRQPIRPGLSSPVSDQTNPARTSSGPKRRSGHVAHAHIPTATGTATTSARPSVDEAGVRRVRRRQDERDREGGRGDASGADHGEHDPPPAGLCDPAAARPFTSITRSVFARSSTREDAEDLREFAGLAPAAERAPWSAQRARSATGPKACLRRNAETPQELTDRVPSYSSVESSTIVAFGAAEWIRAAASSPSISGMRTSSSTRSGRSSAASATASAPDAASASGTNPGVASITSRATLRKIAWSSTVRTLTKERSARVLRDRWGSQQHVV